MLFVEAYFFMAKKGSNKDYDEYKVKVPKKDKNGKDITKDKLGGGGRHREDGTISGMAYDFEPLDSNKEEKLQRKNEELQQEIDRLKYKEYEREFEDNNTNTVDTVGEILELINNGLEFLNENPEVLEFIIDKGIKIKNFAAPRISSFISKVTGKKEKAIEAKIVNVASGMKKQNEVKEATEILSKIDEDYDVDSVIDNTSDDAEELSLEEARSLVIEILVKYISMKKNIERLKKARLNGNNYENLDLDDVLSYLDKLVDEYPQLMDITTVESVNSILNDNAALIESQKVKEVLRIAY